VRVRYVGLVVTLAWLCKGMCKDEGLEGVQPLDNCMLCMQSSSSCSYLPAILAHGLPLCLQASPPTCVLVHVYPRHAFGPGRMERRLGLPVAGVVHVVCTRKAASRSEQQRMLAPGCGCLPGASCWLQKA
jgi:hypothetical protein